MAIGPAPTQSCYIAGIRYLLGPKRSVVGGLVKSPNRLRWLAHGELPNRLRWLAHGELPNRLRSLAHGELPNRLRSLAHGELPNRLRWLAHGVADLLSQPLWIDISMLQIWDRSRFGILRTF